MALDHLPVIVSGNNFVTLPGGEKLANWAVDFTPPNALYNASALRGTNVSTVSPAVGQTLVYDGISYTPSTLVAAAGVTDHGALTGLLDNDHPQYALLSAILNHFTGAVEVSGGIDVTGGAQFTGDIQGNNDIHITGNLTVTGVHNLSSDASSIRGVAISSTINPMDGGVFMYSGTRLTLMPTYGTAFPSGAPHGFEFTRPDLSADGPYTFRRDVGRSAWLATDGFELVATDFSSVSTGEHLSYPGGTKMAASAGYFIPYNFVVTGAICWQNTSVSSVTFRLRRNGTLVANAVISAGNTQQSTWNTNSLCPACLLSSDTYAITVTLGTPTSGLGVRFLCKRIAY